MGLGRDGAPGRVGVVSPVGRARAGPQLRAELQRAAPRGPRRGAVGQQGGRSCVLGREMGAGPGPPRGARGLLRPRNTPRRAGGPGVRRMRLAGGPPPPPSPAASDTCSGGSSGRPGSPRVRSYSFLDSGVWSSFSMVGAVGTRWGPGQRRPVCRVSGLVITVTAVSRRLGWGCGHPGRDFTRKGVVSR